MSYTVKDMLLTPNKYSRPQVATRKIKGIVIHWVANPNTSAEANRNYFESRKHGNRGYGSAHEIIDLDGVVVKCLPSDEMGYHVGSKTYTSEALNSLSSYPNNCTYGIECTHTNWDGEMTDETYTTLVERCADLCEKWNLNPLDDLWLHQEVVGWKDCHRWFVNNPSEWTAFKERVNQEINGPGSKESEIDTNKGIGIVEVLASQLNIRTESNFDSDVRKVASQGDRFYAYGREKGMYNLGGGLWTTANEKYVSFTPHPEKPTSKERVDEEMSLEGKELAKWQLEIAFKAIDELNEIEYEDGKKIINSPKAWKEKVANNPEQIHEDLPWLFFELMRRIAKVK